MRIIQYKKWGNRTAPDLFVPRKSRDFRPWIAEELRYSINQSGIVHLNDCITRAKQHKGSDGFLDAFTMLSRVENLDFSNNVPTSVKLGRDIMRASSNVM